MIFQNKTKIGESQLREVIIECTCGTHLIKVSTYDDDDDVYFLENWSSNFYTKQKENIFKRIGHRLKLVWYAIRGKEYRLEDIVLNKEDFDNLINALLEIKETKMGGEK